MKLLARFLGLLLLLAGMFFVAVSLIDLGGQHPEVRRQWFWLGSADAMQWLGFALLLAGAGVGFWAVRKSA